MQSVLIGTREVHPSLPGPLAQGLFAKPATYPAILRFSTNPGDLLADSVSSPRGLAVKVLNVDGEMLPSHAGSTTQDFLCIDAKTFGAPDPAGFRKLVQILDKTLEVSEPVRHAVSTLVRGTNAAFGAVGIHLGALDALGHL